MEISSLQEMMDILDTVDVNKYYFRGEKHFYPKMVSSAFRPKDNGEFMPFNKMIEEYYKKVGYTLTDIERANFIYYCQHHGLPTNLLDISDNILTACFFSVEDNLAESSYLYFIDKSKCFIIDRSISDSIDYSQILIDFTKNILSNDFVIVRSYVSLFETNKQYLVECMLSLFKMYEIFMKNPMCAIFTREDERLVFEVNELINKNHDFSFSEVCTYYNKFYNLYKNVGTEEYIKNYDKLFESYSEYFGSLLFDLKPFFFFLNYYLINLKQCVDPDVFTLPLMPYIIAQPSVLFDRMLSQEGSFILQHHFFNIDILEGEIILPSDIKNEFKKIVMSQPIITDKTIKILNKKKIYKQLTELGITRAKLFPDNDTIATELVNKYSS